MSEEDIAQTPLFVKEVPTMFCDTHAHLCSEPMWHNATKTLASAKQKGLKKINLIATNAQELERAKLLQQNDPDFLTITASTTPHEALVKNDPFFDRVEQAAFSKEIVAIGETGLEYYHPGLDKALQQEYLIRYFDLAKRSKLPIVFHCREAFSDLFLLSDRHYPAGKALIHCFSGGMQEAKEALQRGWLLSISGIATYKKSEELRQVIAWAPLESLVCETDSPYLSPQSKRKEGNVPENVIEVYALIAQLKNTPLEAVQKTIFSSASQFFSF